MISPINNTALAGIQAGLDAMQESTGQIAGKSSVEGENTQPLVESLVELKAGSQQVSASVKLLEVTDQLIGSLLDTKA